VLETLVAPQRTTAASGPVNGFRTDVMDDVFLVCSFCFFNQRVVLLELDRQRLVWICPICGGGYSCQLLQALTGYSP
jgi:hypothetical protein